MRNLDIAVLMGGWANERPVSLMSGEGIAKALAERGHRVTRIDMDRKVAARIAEVAPDIPHLLHSQHSRKIASVLRILNITLILEQILCIVHFAEL